MMKKLTLDKYCAGALSRGAAWARAVPASYVVTAPWVRFKCQFGCECYDARHLCPPETPTPAETAAVIRGYRQAILIKYDSDPRVTQRARRKKVHQDLLALEREIFLDGYHKALAFVAGPCNLCKVCDVSKPCLRPGEPRPSMESCGIDVFSTFARAGVKLEVVANEGLPYFLCGLILVE